MSNYHTTYKALDGETTEWDDLMVKYGNKAAPEAPWKPDAYRPEDEEKHDASWLDKKTEGELDELDDEFDDDRILEEYRRKRMEEMQAAARKPRFGEVEHLRREEWSEKITKAGEKVWVVVHLYKEGKDECGLLAELLTKLAAKYTNTKFLKIKSTDAISNYPDRNVPTVLVYNKGEPQKTLIGLAPYGGRRATVEGLEWALSAVGPVLKAEGDAADGNRDVEDLQKRFLESLIAQTENAEAADIDE